MKRAQGAFVRLAAAMLCIGGCSRTEDGESGAVEDADGGATTMQATSDGAPATVSYRDDVRPIFATRCTSCHHADNAVGISIVDPFDPETGLVGSKNTWAEVHPEGNTPELNVAPGDPDNSFLIDKISNPNLDPAVAGNFMPWNIPRLTAEELAALRTWIADGAANDASFAANIRPIFGDPTKLGAAGGKCTYCHQPGGQPPNLADPFDPVAGAVNVPSLLDPDRMRIEPGNPDNSFLVIKVEATEPGAYGAPMPMHFEPLTAEEIATIATWIEEGAQNN